MSKAILLDENFKKCSNIEISKELDNISQQNLYLYIKSYLASFRSNSANTKTRSTIRGGGRKPWSQKGRGSARAGSIRSPIWVGGAVAHGPKNFKNYTQKVNKKQKRLSLLYSINYKAQSGSLYIIDKLEVPSGKTKDASKILCSLNVKDVLIIKDNMDEKTFLAFGNLKNALIIEPSSIDPYLISAFDCVLFEKETFKGMFANIIEEELK